MEMECRKIFYTGILYGKYPDKGCRLKKEGLPIRKLDREFSYLLGKGRKNMGKLRIYFTLLPEYAKGPLFGRKTLEGGAFPGTKPRTWKPALAGALLDRAWERAYGELGCTERVMGAEFSADVWEMPLEVWAVCLYRQRPFDSICISLPEEGEQRFSELWELVVPYLPRLRRVAFRGRKSQLSELLEVQLYEEYGIVLTDTDGISEGMVFLDFDQRPGEGDRDFCPTEGKCVTYAETWKFLDTAVKNGYNTKVN